MGLLAAKKAFHPQLLVWSPLASNTCRLNWAAPRCATCRAAQCKLQWEFLRYERLRALLLYIVMKSQSHVCSASRRWCSTRQRGARFCLSAATRRTCLGRWQRSGSFLCPVSQSTMRRQLCREDRRSNALVCFASYYPWCSEAKAAWHHHNHLICLMS